jgi:L-lactate dehydrogenase complex protein LldG
VARSARAAGRNGDGEAAMKSAREQILGRIPAAAGGAPPGHLAEVTAWPPEKLLARFMAEASALGAEILEADSAASAAEYLRQLAEQKGGEVVEARRPLVDALGLGGPRFHPQGTFPAADATLSITQADYGLADTGSLVLFSTEGEGRTLSLLAPVNAVVLLASRILSGLPELFAREPAIAERSSAMVMVTGPSRTADIELTLTIGVHGPGELHIVIL